MKKRNIYIIAAMTALLICGGQLISQPTGAPAPASGGPNEGGATCSQGGCHFGAASAITNVLSSDIPVGGYTPGTTYTITVSVTGSGSKGFMVSAQNASGTFMGTVASGSGSKKVFTNYITHSSSKFSSPAIWTFQWTAPAAGSGAVTLYGAFAITQSSTRTQQITVQENLSPTGLAEVSNGSTFTVSPNPIVDETTLSYNIKEKGPVAIRLVSLDGKVSEVLYSGQQEAGVQSQQLNLSKFSSGIYFMQVETPSGTAYQKVLINR